MLITKTKIYKSNVDNNVNFSSSSCSMNVSINDVLLLNVCLDHHYRYVVVQYPILLLVHTSKFENVLNHHHYCETWLA
ncbi:hypothetical protein DERP_010052 [Dermatophagoides pteronyssinus]|uniref:Uncharacterized protein n=1 Tax=Dermatophagoides pteronyssinus TaxID=6956 RepID=A0ABQ8JES2_DERPT|nr:hypothetical protein DERP_010052 [Dermatophagoides pteronyssinus]